MIKTIYIDLQRYHRKVALFEQTPQLKLLLKLNNVNENNVNCCKFCFLLQNFVKKMNNVKNVYKLIIKNVNNNKIFPKDFYYYIEFLSSVFS